MENIKEINWGKVNIDFSKTTKREKWLIKVLQEYKEVSIPKCNGCGKIATRQIEKGKDAEKGFHLPRNYGWYCKKCWEKGTQLENEAMYGN